MPDHASQGYTMCGAAINEFAVLASRLFADPAAAEALGAIEDADTFAARLIDVARVRGVTLADDALRAMAAPDPIGITRWTPPLVTGTAWPPPAFLPIHVGADADGVACVDWAWFGARRLTESFFEVEIRRALRRPFARLFRYRMRLADFFAHAPTVSLPPSGFIFHMSRCGSTLAARMLAALPAHVLIAEAPPIDAVLHLIGHEAGASDAARLLAAMIAAYGRPRAGNERRLFVKLDSWHALRLPLFRRAFPGVPWVFLYRDPIEVLVSQMRRRGSQMVPEMVPPSLYNIIGVESMSDAEYCARVLATICTAAADADGDGRLMVNYRDLPEALFTHILPHFDVTLSTDEIEAMRSAARYDAKAPTFVFAADTVAKQREASPTLRAACDAHLAPVYRRLEALEGAAS